MRVRRELPKSWLGALLGRVSATTLAVATVLYESGSDEVMGDELARAAGMSRNTVTKALRELQEMGAAKREGRTMHLVFPNGCAKSGSCAQTHISLLKRDTEEKTEEGTKDQPEADSSLSLQASSSDQESEKRGSTNAQQECVWQQIRTTYAKSFRLAPPALAVLAPPYICKRQAVRAADGAGLEAVCAAIAAAPQDKWIVREFLSQRRVPPLQRLLSDKVLPGLLAQGVKP